MTKKTGKVDTEPKNNVINLTERLKKSGKTTSTKINELKEVHVTEPKIIDITDRRKEKIAAERRFVTRTVLAQFVGVFVVLPKIRTVSGTVPGLQPVALHDVSESGLSFDLPFETGAFDIGESVTMRIYLSHDTYFSYGVKVANVRPVPEKGVMRHGTVLTKDDESYRTLFYFMKFLENVSSVAKKDNGDRLIGRVD